MLYYIGILFVCFFLFFGFRKEWSRDIVSSLFFTLLGLFLCFGYTTGTDWRTYENLYHWTEDSATSMFLFMEPGYVLLNWAANSLGIDFFHFFIALKLIIYIVFVKALKFYCPKGTIFISLMFFIAWYAYFFFIDNPMRNMIAIAIFLSSLKYMRERRFKPFLMMTLLAMSFHFSAIIMLLFYYFGNKSYKTRNIVIVYIVLSVLLLNRSIIFSILDSLLSSVPIIGDKIAAYAEPDSEDGGGKLLSLGLIVHTLIFILLILGRDKIEQNPHGKMIFTLSVIFSILFRLGLTITVMGRFQFYIAVFYVASIGMLYYAFEARSRMLYLLFVLLVSVGPCMSYLIKDSRYIPYTNYLFFIGNDMSFEERSQYNPNNSPYKAPGE